MATLALAAAGAAIGGALLPGGITLLGATLTGAALGAQIGALAGSVVDQALLGGSASGRTIYGPRLADLHVTGSSEGAPIPRLYGTARLGGQVIWATDFEEQVIRSRVGGGKGLPVGGGAKQVEYKYFANFAVGICQGEISGIARVWADGKELDLSNVVYRIHTGSETQLPDALIEAVEGADLAPAFRGLAYIVFERLPLADFGNRIPQLSFEVSRPVDDFHRKVRGVVMIPGSGEFVYATTAITKSGDASDTENVNTLAPGTDFSASVDQLEAQLPNARAVSLVVSWFGNDLRASHCQLQPGVDRTDKPTVPYAWSVSGVNRANAYVVTRHDDVAAYGGTPSDRSVIEAIQHLKARGIAVLLTPFILMDIAPGNALPDPYGNASQVPYPWRGRITTSVAPGLTGTPDKSAAAAAEILAFIGTAAPTDFAVVGETVTYSGPVEWSLRRMVLHYASLAKAAGGIDGFVLGSELRGLTQVRDSTSTYPFVEALRLLAADVRSILGPSTKITYAADWSEYFGHQPADGSGDVYFHLDPLWSSQDIDAIGIDCYWPLADWRDGRDHVDWSAGFRSEHDLAYLKGNLFGGEGFDWYYASAEDRDAQQRTSITDGAGKPWVYRFKDIRAWWSEQHFNRPGGVEATSPTGWIPQSKPIWFTEVGCPAIDKGANQPNVFVDPKSSESAIPYASSGARDDLAQRQYLTAFIEAFDPDDPGGVPAANPISTVYGAPMIDLDRVLVYAWDARPFPAYPANSGLWGDTASWYLGHWLNGRTLSTTLAGTVAAILEETGFTDYDASGLLGIVPGFVVDRIMSPREAMQPLERAYFIDVLESDGAIRFRRRMANEPIAHITADDLVETRADDPLFSVARSQESELPAIIKLAHISDAGEYRQVVAESRRIASQSGRTATGELPIVMDSAFAGAIADAWMFESWIAREQATFSLPPTRLAIEPGDGVVLDTGAHRQLYRVIEMGNHGPLDIAARASDPAIYRLRPQTSRAMAPPVPGLGGQPVVAFLDLPLLSDDHPDHVGYLAAFKRPWPGPIAFYRAPEAAGFALDATAEAPAILGTLTEPLLDGPHSRIDRAGTINVRLQDGALSSATPLAFLAGANAAAIRHDTGEWEVLQFETATLVGPSTYRLSRLLRGQLGTEHVAASAASIGARFVLLDAAIIQTALSADEIRLPLEWRVGPATRPYSDPTYMATQHAFRGVGARPFSPVHVRATRMGEDIRMTWIRRTRTGGDSWDSLDVPLGEERELYEVDVLSSGTVIRTLAATDTVATYTRAEQIVDFGEPQPSVEIAIHQISARFGRGPAAHAIV